tara:strand:+ start:478 stop:675 length:198 start_codon:yes stop_codon:yes gene_type:complete
MPQPVLTKYKQGDLGADYPKDKPVGKELDIKGQIPSWEDRKDMFPNKNRNQVEPSFNKMADEKDY